MTTRFTIAAAVAIFALAGPLASHSSAAGCGIFGLGRLATRVADAIQTWRESRIEARNHRIEARQLRASATALATALATSDAVATLEPCPTCSGSGYQVRYSTVSKTVDAKGNCTLCAGNCACPSCQCGLAQASKAAPTVKSYRLETYYQNVCTTDARGRSMCTQVPMTRIVAE